MKYNDLKKLASERGLEASGTKEDLLARLQDADGAGAPAPAPNAPEGDSNEGAASNENAPKAPAEPTPAEKTVITPAEEQGETRKAERQLMTDARKMKEHLEKQPKVSMMIPFETGENPEQAKKVPFHVNMNGYAMDFPRGVYVDVPKQVAELIKERLESEGKIGSQWRVDRDASKADALA